MEYMNKKTTLNYKKGFRRITIVLITIGTLIVIFNEWGRIQSDNYASFMQQVKFCSNEFETCISPSEFNSRYLFNYVEIAGELECYPLDQSCIGEGMLPIKANAIVPFDPDLLEKRTRYIISNTDDFLYFKLKVLKEDKEAKLVMPNRIQYLSWYCIDIFTIIFKGFFAFLIYLLLEFACPYIFKSITLVINWFIKGFKD